MPYGTESDYSGPEDQEEPLKEYEYRPLTSPSSIRLLKLQPGAAKGQEIICELVESKLDGSQLDDEKHLSYEAVSWSWGITPWDDKIKIRHADQAFLFNVPRNLYAALTSLRRKGRVRVLWVDAICINQRNPEERNRQVPMMAKIYGSALKVCIWLGEADEDSTKAINFIKQEVLKLQGFDELCESEEKTGSWRAMLNLMKRPWFSRRWVVQEIALANNAEIYCGTKTIAWKDFADAVQLFVEVETATHRLSEVMRKDPNFYHVPGWFEYVSALGASLLVDATGSLFRVSRDKKRQPLLSLEYLVSKLSAFTASEPRDTIYALLAIANDTKPIAVIREPTTTTPDQVPAKAQLSAWASRHSQAKPYKVDYELPFVEIYKDFIFFSIRQSIKGDPTRALDIICRPWAPDPKKKTIWDKDSDTDPSFYGEQEETLPSWIPRLKGAAYSMFMYANSEMKMNRQNADPLVGLPNPGQRNYSAAETRAVQIDKLRFKRRPTYYSMYVTGFILDQIEKVEVASQSGNIPEEWVAEAGWRDIEADPPEDFWRTLVADRGRFGRNPPTYYGRACKESITKGLASGSLNTTELINEGRCSVVSEYFRRVQAVIWNRSLMRTQSGNLGIVRKDVRKGDLVCILYGCSVPVILRQVRKSPEALAKEQHDDKHELEEKRIEAAVRIQRAFRHRQRRRATNTSSLQTPCPSAVANGFHSDTESPAKAESDSKAKSKRPVKAKPNIVLSTPETNQETDEMFYYEFVGECYVHGMMDGEAIKHQNQDEIPARTFELR